MITKLTLISKNGVLKLPINYNYQIQAFVYNNIDNDLANFLHNHGYIWNNRKIKLFTFSKFSGNYHVENRIITFTGPVNLYIASPITKFNQSIINNMLLKKNLFLVNQSIKIIDVNVIDVDAKSKAFKSLSPVTAYSTLIDNFNKKRTIFYKPNQEEFKILLEKNLYKKYEVIFGKKYEGGGINFSFCDFKKNITNYKGFIIEAYFINKILIEGDDRLLKVALNNGLGSKNSQGFGMIISVESKGRENSD